MKRNGVAGMGALAVFLLGLRGLGGPSPDPPPSAAGMMKHKIAEDFALSLKKNREEARFVSGSTGRTELLIDHFMKV
jgi:hypothetical protein